MIKTYALLPKRQDITKDRFHEHWSTVHREHALRITSLRRYVQAHRLPVDVPGFRTAPYDGIPEVWQDSLQAAAAQNDDPDYTGYAQLDEPNFVDMDGIAWVLTDERLLRDDLPLEQDTEVHKLLVFAKRAPGASVTEFAGAWASAADAVVARTGVLRAAVATTLPETYADGEPTYDGVLELWWADQASFADAWAEHGSHVRALVDGPADPATVRAAAVRELRVIWPGPPRDPVGVATTSTTTEHHEGT